MTRDSDIKQIIAATRDLVRRSDQGLAIQVKRLAQPLPPLLRDNSDQTLQAFHALTSFDPFDSLGGRLEQAATSPASGLKEKVRQRAVNSSPAGRGNPYRPTLSFDPQRAPVAGADAIRPAQPCPSGSKAASPGGVNKARPKDAPLPPNPDMRQFDTAPRNLTAREFDNSSPDPHPERRETAHSPPQLRQTHNSQRPAPLFTLRPNPPSHAERLAARRKTYAQEHHETVREPDAVQSRPGGREQSSLETATASQSHTKAPHHKPRDIDAKRRTETVTGSRPSARTLDAAVRSSPIPSESGTLPHLGNSSPQTVEANKPLHSELVSAELATSTSPFAAQNQTQLREEDLARQLADTAYLHGIDLT